MQDMALVILAAGASRRMRGRDKLLEPVDATWVSVVMRYLPA